MSLWARVNGDERAIVARFARDVPVKVGALAEALGIVVLRSSLPLNIAGQIEPAKDAPSGYRIKVNRHDTPERQRFTVAHEIGHYLLHRDVIGDGVTDSILYRSSLGSFRETEANQIAADIVMPATVLKEALAEIGGVRDDGAVERLASKFKVSKPAMAIRLGV
jgi:Zn-dependent peptidase ImmA (M78 family)